MGTQEQPTEIGVEDLTAKLKEANFFRVRYFAKKHKDLQQQGYRTAKNIDWIQSASLRKEAIN
jgi:hypothetical protein